MRAAILSLGLAIGAWSGGVALAGSSPAPARPVVAELFTSQGCSSCPPADELLGEIASKRPDVLALAFHITYWDGLGWADPFSLRAATARQRDYAAALRLDTIYTPQLIVDGISDIVGSDRPGVLSAIEVAAAEQADPVALRVTREGGKARIVVGAGKGEGDLVVIGYDPRHVTPVGRGENQGRTLAEFNVVRGVARAAAWRGGALDVTVDAPPGERIAVLLQAPNRRILGAARES